MKLRSPYISKRDMSRTIYFFILGILLLPLAACYEAHTEVIPAEAAIKLDLIKDLAFEGRTVDNEGNVSQDADSYRIVGRQPPNDYLYETDDPLFEPRTLRFMELDKDLYLMQINPQGSPRYQIMLLRKNGQAYEAIRPNPFNKEGIDTFRSQEAFADQLGIRFYGQQMGPYHLEGAPDKIKIFMHSLTTLPTQVYYRFTRK